MFTIEKSSTEVPSNSLPWVDLCFNVIGKTLPAEHGYGLYSALTHWQQELHNLDGWSLQTITGIADKQGIIYLGDRSYLRLRFAYQRLSFFYPLAGKSLKIGKHTIRFGIPQIEILQPAKKLRSRLVVIKSYQEPESFLKAAQRQLDKLGIHGTAIIPKNIDGEPKRKTIKIKRFTVVGFGLEVINLNKEDSLALQRYGIGGKHKMGCGVFVPVKEELS